MLSPFTPSEAAALDNTAYQTSNGGYLGEEYEEYGDEHYLEDLDGGHYTQGRY